MYKAEETPPFFYMKSQHYTIYRNLKYWHNANIGSGGIPIPVYYEGDTGFSENTTPTSTGYKSICRNFSDSLFERAGYATDSSGKIIGVAFLYTGKTFTGTSISYSYDFRIMVTIQYTISSDLVIDESTVQVGISLVQVDNNGEPSHVADEIVEDTRSDTRHWIYDFTDGKYIVGFFPQSNSGITYQVPTKEFIGVGGVASLYNARFVYAPACFIEWTEDFFKGSDYSGFSDASPENIASEAASYLRRLENGSTSTNFTESPYSGIPLMDAYGSGSYRTILYLYSAYTARLNTNSISTASEIMSRLDELLALNPIIWNGGNGEIASIDLADRLKAMNPVIWTEEYYNNAISLISGNRLAADCSFICGYAYGMSTFGVHGPTTNYFHYVLNGGTYTILTSLKTGYIVTRVDMDDDGIYHTDCGIYDNREGKAIVWSARSMAEGVKQTPLSEFKPDYYCYNYQGTYDL